MKADLALYTDYLLCSFGQISATGLSALVDGEPATFDWTVS
jgi:hypothetical protein